MIEALRIKADLVDGRAELEAIRRQIETSLADMDRGLTAICQHRARLTDAFGRVDRAIGLSDRYLELVGAKS